MSLFLLNIPNDILLVIIQHTIRKILREDKSQSTKSLVLVCKTFRNIVLSLQEKQWLDTLEDTFELYEMCFIPGFKIAFIQGIGTFVFNLLNRSKRLLYRFVY